MDIDQTNVEIAQNAVRDQEKPAAAKEKSSDPKKKEKRSPSEGHVKKVFVEPDVDEFNRAMKCLKESKFDDRIETKKCFDAIYRIFNRFKTDVVVRGGDEDQDKVLDLYFPLMIEIIEYIQSPSYNNFFKEFDRKLTKNILKRCIVEPFADRIMRKKVRETDKNAEAFALWREGKGPNPQSLDLEQTFEIDLYEKDD